jgi:hypothetical protein
MHNICQLRMFIIYVIRIGLETRSTYHNNGRGIVNVGEDAGGDLTESNGRKARQLALEFLAELCFKNIILAELFF